MARSFNGTSTVITAASAPTPTGSSDRTHAFWFRTTSVTTRQTLLYTGAESTNARFAIECRDSKIDLNTFTSRLTCATTLSNDTWYHVMVTLSGGSTWTVYLNGSSDGTGTSTFNTGTGFSVGANNASALWLTGQLAEWAGWSTANSAGDALAMAKGFSPRRVRPQSLVFYAPLVRDVKDIKGALALTDSIPTGVSDHPRTYA